MKNLDLISKRILIAGIVLCGTLLCASLLVVSIGSITKSYAAPIDQTYQQNVSAAATGDIMCSTSNTANDRQYIFWNTTTGKSVVFWFTDGKWGKSDYQLPADPFE